MSHHTPEFVPLTMAVLTVSDTRTAANDTSGDTLVQRLTDAGHQLGDRDLLADDVYLLRARVSGWIADPRIHVVLTTGGTGFSGRDSTPEALSVLFDKPVDGFGEYFRHISVPQIGTATLQSRALAGLANSTLVACLPGSTNACRTGWDDLLAAQLDARTRPCNFVPHLNLSTGCSSREAQ